MKTAVNPIHWECYVTEPGKPTEKAKVVDLRALPEEVKVSILQAALHVGERYDSGDFEGVEEGSDDAGALEALAVSARAVRHYMHEVNLTTRL